MFQNLVSDQIFAPAPADNALTFAAGLTAPTFEVAAASLAYKARYVGILNPTLVLNDWYGIGVGVSDPELRGPMVLSYSIGLSGAASGQTSITGFVLDRQAATPLAAGAQVTIAPATDLAWSFPPTERLSLACRGRMLVNSSIVSATPGVTTREFLAGFALTASAGAVRLFVDIAIELYADQTAFFQPFK